MLSVTLEPLPQKVDDDLRKWLGNDACRTFVRVVDAQVKKYQALALKEAVQGNPGNLKLESGNDNLLRAQRYQACLDVLDEMITTQGSHQTAKVT